MMTVMTRVRKQPIIALYFEFGTVLKFCYLEAWHRGYKACLCSTQLSMNLSCSKIYVKMPPIVTIQGLFECHLRVVKSGDISEEAVGSLQTYYMNVVVVPALWGAQRVRASPASLRCCP